MTGRCVCKPGYEGLKCGLCAGSQARIGTYGCMGNVDTKTSFIIGAPVAQWVKHWPTDLVDRV